MSKIIEGVFRNKLRERPFDFYVAFVLFMLGLYGIFDQGFPESVINGYVWLLHVICLYFMASSLVIMLSLSCRKDKHPVLALMGEMYGWIFIAAAASATAVSYLTTFLNGGPESIVSWFIWLLIWVGMATASMVRALDLYNFYRSLKK